MATNETILQQPASQNSLTGSSTVGSNKPQKLIGPQRLTRFERARIIGARALQIAMGAPLLIKTPTGTTDPVDIASYELQQGVLPITVRRKLPDGMYQDVPISWLLPKV